MLRDPFEAGKACTRYLKCGLSRTCDMLGPEMNLEGPTFGIVHNVVEEYLRHTPISFH
jgi:hypothetical protein